MNTLSAGEIIPSHKLETIESGRVDIPAINKTVHLQFRRFAGCPFCNVHLQTFIQRHHDIVAAGINEIVVFRSSASSLQRHHGGAPFAMIADPKGALYDEFGVGHGLRALADPRALSRALAKVVHMFPRLPGLPTDKKAALGLPADFLITPDGRVLACKYGKHADDQWSVDELLNLVKQRAS